MNTQTPLQAVAEFMEDKAVLHAVVHGPASGPGSTVVTEANPAQPSVAKATADAFAALNNAAFFNGPVADIITDLTGEEPDGFRALVAHSGTSGALIEREDQVVQINGGEPGFSGPPSAGARLVIQSKKRPYSYLPGTGWVPVRSEQPVFALPDDSALANAGTPGAAALQTAIDALPSHSLVPLTVGGSAVVNAPAIIGLYAQRLATRLNIGIKITKSQLVLENGWLNADDGVTALLWNFVGSSEKSGVLLRRIFIANGAIGLDIGQNADSMPLYMEHGGLFNQTVAGVKTGNFSRNIVLYHTRISGCSGIPILHRGSGADGFDVDKCEIGYNTGPTDILIENAANTMRVRNTLHFGQVSHNPTVTIDSTVNESGNSCLFEGNKYGPEGRDRGCIFRLRGPNPIIGLSIINNKPFSFEPGPHARGGVLVEGTPLGGFTYEGNEIGYAPEFHPDSTFKTEGSHGENRVNNFLYPYEVKGPVTRSNFQVMKRVESAEKENLLHWSRAENSLADYSLTNLDPSYLTETDWQGNATNASKFTAGSGGQGIWQIDVVNTNQVQGFYSFPIWLKMGAAANIGAAMFRGSNYVINRGLRVGTSWERFVFEFYQQYLADGNPYSFQLQIPASSTLYIGDHGLYAGSDPGDFFAYKTPRVKQMGPRQYRADAMPTAGRFRRGAFVINSSPDVAGGAYVRGWDRLTDGAAHVLGVDWAAITNSVA